MTTLEDQINYVSKLPRRAGKAAYLKYLKGEKLSPRAAISAHCFYCNPDGEKCAVVLCPHLPYQAKEKPL